MAGEEQGSNGHDAEWRLDLDALAPVRAGVVRIGGTDYDVRHFLDVPVEQLTRALRLEDTKIQDEELEAFAARSAEVIKIFAPTIPDEAFRLLSTHRLRMLVKRVLAVSEVPPSDSPPAEDPGPSSGGSSPASGVSTEAPSAA